MSYEPVQCEGKRENFQLLMERQWMPYSVSIRLSSIAATILYITVGFTMGKAEEWGNPVSEEALVRQGNDKCYQHRKPGLKKN